MENVDLDQVIKEFNNLDIPNNDMIIWIPALIDEINSLRLENKKLMKIVDAADKNANRDITYEEHALYQALREWKGEK